MRLALPMLLAAALLLPSVADAQVYVAPRRPGKSVVRYTVHDWRSVDLLVGETVHGATSGGVRLFFYEAERETAERAAFRIEAAYAELAEDFDYTPEEIFPFVLYSSYQEFLRTNLFPVQEGTLGVTSPESLEVTLPYFGDHRMFREVAKHELAHQFTIQKVRSVANAADAPMDPLNNMPLWFIEGLAEYYAHGGLDPDTEAALRDLVSNPDILRYVGVPDMWFDYPGSVVWTYRVGQARVAFLEETYGEGTVQRILARAPELVSGSTVFQRGDGLAFAELVASVVGERQEQVATRFRTWTNRRFFPQWLAAEQDMAEFVPLSAVRGMVGALDASPDGSLLMYRSIDEETGRGQLWLTDPRSPERARKVAIAGGPGEESLHPVDERSFDLGDGVFVYVSESAGFDRLIWRRFTSKSRERRAKPALGPDTDGPIVRFNLERQELIELEPYGLVAAFSPSISPDGAEVAFVGMGQDGTKDLWIATLVAGGAELRRVTEDVYAERGLSWGPAGLIYSSDRTEHGFYNLFRYDPKTGGDPTRLTTAPVDHEHPVVLPDGRVLFVAGRDLFELSADGVAQRSAIPTSVSDPSPGPDGGLWALMLMRGDAQPARLDGRALLDGPPVPVAPAPALNPDPLPRRTLDTDTAYRPLSPSNWDIENVFGVVGAGAGVIYGQAYVAAADQLRDHSLVLTVAAYGSPELTDAQLFYLDQSRRYSWGLGAFQSLRFRIDTTFDDLVFQSGERYMGGAFSVRYPFSRFAYGQLDQAVGVADYFLFDEIEAALSDPEQTGHASDLLPRWESSNEPRIQTETTARIGYDTIQYHRATGPYAGHSAMVEGTFGMHPTRGQLFGSVRLDAEQYFHLPISSSANLGFRVAAGTSAGGRFARSFYLYSYDTLRGVPFGDPNYLLGKNFVFGTAEAQIPLDAVLRLAIASSLEGVVGLDAGAVDDELSNLWDKRVMDVAIGANIILGSLVFRLHWAHPLDIGAPVPEYPTAWVPNVSLTWLEF